MRYARSVRDVRHAAPKPSEAKVRPSQRLNMPYSPLGTLGKAVTAGFTDRVPYFHVQINNFICLEPEDAIPSNRRQLKIHLELLDELSQQARGGNVLPVQ